MFILFRNIYTHKYVYAYKIQIFKICKNLYIFYILYIHTYIYIYNHIIHIYIYINICIYIYLNIYIYIYIYVCVYTLYNGSIPVKPECSIWRAIYTMVRVKLNAYKNWVLSYSYHKIYINICIYIISIMYIDDFFRWM